MNAETRALELILSGIETAIREVETVRLDSIEYLPLDRAKVCVEFSGLTVTFAGIDHERADKIRDIWSASETEREAF